MSEVKREETKLKRNATKRRKEALDKKTSMPAIVCTCGETILLIPDLHAMEKAIQNHLSKHKNADMMNLIGQLFDLASQQDSGRLVPTFFTEIAWPSKDPCSLRKTR